MKELKHGKTLAASLRSDANVRILNTFNDKTPKGERRGYLQAILYLSPHTLASPKSLCPHSTEACRAGCLYTAGRGQMHRIQAARERRTRAFLDDRTTFLRELAAELRYLQGVATAQGLKLAVRLNGTSDVRWELETLGERTLFQLVAGATFFDYSRYPLHHRKTPPNWRLTWSLADAPLTEALEHLRNGQNVAAVVPKAEAAAAPAWFALGDATVTVVDGDQDDLRFLDPSPALVLLKPKGKLRVPGNPMVRKDLIPSLQQLALESA